MSAPAGTDLAAARLLLERLGIEPEQLLGVAPQSHPLPTFDEYIDRVSDAVSDGTRRVYDTYWRKIRTHWGTRRLDEPTSTEIRSLAQRIKNEATPRRNSRGGRSAAEHMISAIRCLYQYAEADRLISAANNPAVRVAKPRRLANNRRSIPDQHLAEIFRIAATTGGDPDLDCLILRRTSRQRVGAAAHSPSPGPTSTPHSR